MNGNKDCHLNVIIAMCKRAGSDSLGVGSYIYIMCVYDFFVTNYGSNLPRVAAIDFLKINSPSAGRNSSD